MMFSFSRVPSSNTHTYTQQEEHSHNPKTHQPLHTKRHPQGNQKTEIYKHETMAGIKIKFSEGHLYSGTLNTRINGHKQKSFMRLGGRGGQTEIDGSEM